MKRTDFEKKEREMRRKSKKAEVLERKGAKGGRSVAAYIGELSGKFLYNDEVILNPEDEPIIELLLEMQVELPEKQWDNVIKKAVNKTQVKQKDDAVHKLRTLLDEWRED